MPTGYCIQEFATRIHQAEKVAPMTVSQVAARCWPGENFFHPNNDNRALPYARKRSLVHADSVTESRRSAAFGQNAGRNPGLLLPQRILEDTPKTRVLGLQPFNGPAQNLQSVVLASQAKVLRRRRTAAEDADDTGPDLTSEDLGGTFNRIDRLDSGRTRGDQDCRPDHRHKNCHYGSGFP